MKIGQTVAADAIIYEVPSEDALRDARRRAFPIVEMGTVKVPDEHRSGGVSSEDYANYRRGLDSACADVVITTVLPSGEPAVLAVKRSSTSCFGGKWWMQGGAVQAYRPLLDFLAERAARECGVPPVFEALIGVYRTTAGDVHASTLQPCYVARVSYEDAARAQADKDHSAYRFITLRDLDQISEAEMHWYPKRVFDLALRSM